ncbi:MAG: ABC transporter permease [Eubacteriales bacterium]|nr:ABC transporter permease [Eubacteriales bacterium]
MGGGTMLILENIRLAFTSIESNKMRSFLTMLGIIIGISSVIAITSIGASAKGAVGKEFEAYGMNYMYIYPNWEMTQDGVDYADLFMPEDIEALKDRFPDDILYVAPYMTINSDTKVGRQEGKLSLYGVNAGYNQFTNMVILHGRMINGSDVQGGKDRIVIEKDAALYFFNKEDPIGETLSVIINDEMKDLTIVGVYEVPPSMFQDMFMSDSYSTYVPYTTLQTGDPATNFIELYTIEGKNLDTLGNEFTSYLARIKDNDPAFYKYDSSESQMTQINTVLGTLSLAIGAIAAISLIVGGIGIMNIMLVSVTERTREIGIRKSLGARTRDILMQFLIEAMILSAIGGIIGTILGVGIAAAGMSFANIAVVIEPGVILLAVGFSAIVGMFFGLYPARKAAKLDPIEALRYE